MKLVAGTCLLLGLVACGVGGYHIYENHQPEPRSETYSSRRDGPQQHRCGRTRLPAGREGPDSYKT